MHVPLPEARTVLFNFQEIIYAIPTLVVRVAVFTCHSDGRLFCGQLPQCSKLRLRHRSPAPACLCGGIQTGAFPAPSQCVAAFGLACYTPSLIRTAYNVPSNLDGTGQTIVIVDAYGSPTIRQDLHIFDQVFGLPDPVLNIIYPGGRPVYNPLQHHSEESWANETSLDVQWAHAIAPGATIDLVIAANNGGNVLNNAVRYAVSHHLGNVISLSWGSPEAAIRGRGNNTQVMQAHQNFQAAQAASISVFASTGDKWGQQGELVCQCGISRVRPAGHIRGGHQPVHR